MDWNDYGETHKPDHLVERRKRIHQSVEEFKAMSPEQQNDMMAQQRQSYVRGEMGMLSEGTVTSRKVWRDCECPQCKEWSVWDTPDYRPHYKFDTVKGYTWSLIGIGATIFWTAVLLWAFGG